MKKIFGVLFLSLIVSSAVLPGNIWATMGSGANDTAAGSSGSASHTQAGTTGSMNASASAGSYGNERASSGRRWYNPFSWFGHRNVNSTASV